MKIFLCGSLTFNMEMMDAKREVEELGHEVDLPQSALDGYSKEWWAELRKSDAGEFLRFKDESMRGHFDKVVWADAILVCNYEKNGVGGYIGPNTLMEMGLGFYLRKKLFLLFPSTQESLEEDMRVLRPSVLNGNVTMVNTLLIAG